MGKLVVEVVQPKEVTFGALQRVDEQAMEQMMALVEHGTAQMCRLLGTVPAPEDIQRAADEVGGAFARVFDGEGQELVPTNRVKVTLSTQEQRFDERIESVWNRTGLGAALSLSAGEMQRSAVGVVNRGQMNPRIIDGEWRYDVEIYDDPLAPLTGSVLSLPKERFQRTLGHEMGHVLQVEYGAIGKITRGFIEIESYMQNLWENMCRLAGREPTRAPLTAEAFAVASHLPFVSDNPLKTKDYLDKSTAYRSLIKKREDGKRGYEGALLNSKMLREGFASWVSDQVSQELGYEENRTYVPSCAVDSPYVEGLARFKSLPPSGALGIGLGKSSDRELVAATTQRRWGLF